MLWSATTPKTLPYLVNCWLEIFSPLFWHFSFLPMLQHWFICIMKHMIYVVLVYTNTLGPLYKCGSCSIYPVSNSGVKTPKVFSPLIHLTYHFSQYILFKGKYVSTTYVHWSSCIAFNDVIWYVLSLQTYHHGRSLLVGNMLCWQSPMVLINCMHVLVQ